MDNIKGINELFFELIRVAIGTQDSLSYIPKPKEWKALYDMAKKQSIVGVCFAALQQLGTDADEGFARIGMSEMQYLTWMGMAAKIQQKNEVVNQKCVELQAKLSADGISSSILKGQGVAALYCEHLRGLRQSGDIDIYVSCGRKKAIEYARNLQGAVDWDYKHLHLQVFPDTEVEMHYVPEVFLNLWKNRELQKWFKDHQDEMFVSQGDFVTPSIEFNLFYILLHIYRHFLYEGVGLRQLMDYYWTLSVSPLKGEDLKCSNAAKAVKLFGMMRFTKGVMWIMKEVFELAEQQMLVEPDEKEGRYILEEVMMGGNFGHHDERLQNSHSGKWSAISKILKHNLHLLAHYPTDVIWAPIWIVYHKIWKLMNR